VFLQWCLIEAASCPLALQYNLKVLPKAVNFGGKKKVTKAEVNYRSHETIALNEDKTLYQLVTAPLQKHFVGGCVAFSSLHS
jgi:hypothetical protein